MEKNMKQLEAILEEFYRRPTPDNKFKSLSAITALIQEAVNEGRVAELKRMLPPNEIHVGLTDYAHHRIKELSGDNDNG